MAFETVKCKKDTRENFAILDESAEKQYRFGMPVNELFKNEWLTCLKFIENQKNVDFIMASGSLPLGVPLDIYAKLSKIAINGSNYELGLSVMSKKRCPNVA